MTPPRPSLVVIGASRGGTAAIAAVLGAMPPDLPVPVVVVLHRGKFNDGALAPALQASSGLIVCEPDDKEPLAPGRIYVAPGDYHLLVERGSLSLSTDAPVHHARPSVDVLFDSAADAYGAGVIAVVLSGTGVDGAEGARAVKEKGGTLVVQAPESAEARGMPDAALAANRADHVLALAEIGPLFRRLCCWTDSGQSAAAADGGEARAQEGRR